MPRQVAILHGWSDTSKSFEPLVNFLDENGFDPVPVWLGDYISLDDDVRIEDVAKRMQQVVQDKISREGLAAPFDMIVHSTGGLVARQWLGDYYPDGQNCPVKRLVMLAPANFGSKLAAMGQSMLGRLIKGWNNWFHTGKEMLKELELASPYQWDLAQRDLFGPDPLHPGSSPYGGNGVWPFVIIGTHPYASGLRQAINENGSDGTVRAAAANLNARGVTIDFASNEESPLTTLWRSRYGDLVFPFAILPDRDHGSIIDPASQGYSSDAPTQGLLGKLILQALQCEGLNRYQAMSVPTQATLDPAFSWQSVIDASPSWADISEATASLSRDDAERGRLFGGQPPTADYFHQYMQVVVRVVDDHGSEVSDFYLEFFAPEAKQNAEAIYFQAKVLEDVHPYGDNKAYRCLFVDRSDLADPTNGYYSKITPATAAKVLAMSISAVFPGGNVSYFHSTARGASGHMIVHRLLENDQASRWLKRNCTHFVEIIIPRVPKDGVFTLTRLPQGR